MAIKPIQYVPLPFSAPRFTPDTRALAALAERQGNDLSLLDLQKGRNAKDFFGTLGELWSGYHAQTQAEKQMKAAMAMKERDRQDTLKEKDADREERAQERAAVLGLQIANARQAQYDKQFGEAKDVVMDTAPGPISDTDPRGQVLSQLIEKFPQLAGRFGTTPRLEARPVGGAPDLDTTAPPLLNRIPTGAEAAQMATAEAAKETAAAALARQNKTDARLEKNDAATQAYRMGMLNKPNANSGAMTDIPGDFNKTGPDFLASIPVEHRKTVEGIAKYELDPTKAVSMRGDARERMIAWVKQVNPDYDTNNFALRAPVRKAFTVGTQGQQINAINTAMGHIDQITSLAEKLNNGKVVPLNAFVNSFKTASGNPAVTNFDTLKDALAGEVAGVLSKGGATVSGIQDAKTHIKAANSPEQLAGYVQTLIPVLGSKLASFDYQYKQAMGAGDPFSPLSDESKRILIKHGFDPSHPTLEGNAPPATGGVRILSITPLPKKP